MTAGTKDPAPYNAPQLKRALTEAGFEVFRTRGDEIALAERVRENLIMDSGVRLRAASPLEVRLVLRAERRDFPAASEDDLWQRVRELGAGALAAGFKEVATAVTPVMDPVDRSRVLDTLFEVTFAREADSLDAAFEGIRFALQLEKAVAPRRGDSGTGSNP